jgi:hypothetical protein
VAVLINGKDTAGHSRVSSSAENAPPPKESGAFLGARHQVMGNSSVAMLPASTACQPGKLTLRRFDE